MAALGNQIREQYTFYDCKVTCESPRLYQANFSWAETSPETL
jgi:hypothetical protein